YTVVSNDVGDGLSDLPALGKQFCQWFFTLLNSQNPIQGQLAQDWDARLRLLLHTGDQRSDEFNGAEMDKSVCCSARTWRLGPSTVTMPALAFLRKCLGSFAHQWMIIAGK
ncbi:hypothetical protein M9458_019439, partial [Cirrhinus mrigala]